MQSIILNAQLGAALKYCASGNTRTLISTDTLLKAKVKPSLINLLMSYVEG